MYIMLKDIFEPETYIIKCMSRRRRSLMSQFRTGILPLEIETGRYVPIFGKTLKCVCPVYNSRRRILFEEVELNHVHFHTLSLSDKFIFCNDALPIEVSKCIHEAWSIRQIKL